MHENGFCDLVVQRGEKDEALAHGLVERDAVGVARLHANHFAVLVLHHHHLLRPRHALRQQLDHLLRQKRVVALRRRAAARAREAAREEGGPLLPEASAQLQELAIGRAGETEDVGGESEVERPLGLEELRVLLCDAGEEERQRVQKVQLRGGKLRVQRHQVARGVQKALLPLRICERPAKKSRKRRSDCRTSEG